MIDEIILPSNPDMPNTLEYTNVTPPTEAKPLKEIQVNKRKRSAETIERLPSKRNMELLRDYTQGLGVGELATKYLITETRVYQILKRWKDLLKLNREDERLRRIRRLKKVENNTPENLAPRTASELVSVIEAQRKELEGDSQVSTINNTIINVDKIQIANLNDSDKLAKLRAMLDGA